MNRVGYSRTIRNRFNGKEYLVSIIPVEKQLSIPNAVKRSAKENDDEFTNIFASTFSEPEMFNHICYEAAIFSGSPFEKPLFLILLNRENYIGNGEDFRDLVYHILENESIENVYNFKTEPENIYQKYGFKAVQSDVWQVSLNSDLRMIIISDDVFNK